LAQVTWTEQALDDLEAICNFIARDAPRYAELFAERLFQATDRLANFPASGRIVPEVGRNNIREVILQGYRVIYHIQGDEVEVLTIHHGARLLRGF